MWYIGFYRQKKGFLSTRTFFREEIFIQLANTLKNFLQLNESITKFSLNKFFQVISIAVPFFLFIEKNILLLVV